MAYCTLTEVKEVLCITDASNDTELTSIITMVDDFIDEYLRPYVTTPLSPTPSAVNKISTKWAAGEFRYRRHPEGDEHPWIKEAKLMLEKYIESNYLQPTFKASGGLKSGE